LRDPASNDYGRPTGRRCDAAATALADFWWREAAEIERSIQNVTNSITVHAPDLRSAAAMVGFHLDRNAHDLTSNLQGPCNDRRGPCIACGAV
jgi:hypothetical protein